tara:strand:+ start:1489 stop:2214 length:726 start_codon:yes stop_codon:yes gene_type:complete
MQKRNKNNSSKKIEIHQFKSNFFIGDDNNFKVLNLKSFSKVDLDTENVTIIHFNKPPVIVPNKLFIKDNLNKYLSTNYKLSNNLSVGYDETSNKSLNIVYEKKKNLENLLDKNGIEFISINYFTGIYEYLTLLKKNDEMSIYINLRNSLFDIIIYNKDEFLYFNTFNKKNKEEFLYYLLYVLKNFQADVNSTKINFLGKFEEFKEYYDYTSLYAEIIYIENNIQTINNIKHESPFFLNSII